MADPFDPYREALVVEQRTRWPAEVRASTGDWSSDDRQRAERLLHADPASAAELEYVRVHTGFCRQVTVTAADVERLATQLQS